MADYDNPMKCPKCGNSHKVKTIASINGLVCEAETSCTCGHTDYWATGFYKSKSEPKG